MIEKVKNYMVALSAPVSIEELSKDLIMPEDVVSNAIKELYKQGCIDSYPAAGRSPVRYKLVLGKEPVKTAESEIKNYMMDLEKEVAKELQPNGPVVYLIKDGDEVEKKVLGEKEKAISEAEKIAKERPNSKITILAVVEAMVITLQPVVNEIDLTEV